VRKVICGGESLSFERADFFETTECGKFVWSEQPFENLEFEGEKGEKAFEAVVSANKCFNVVAFLGKIINIVLRSKSELNISFTLPN
jgi:hypothetical protein